MIIVWPAAYYHDGSDRRRLRHWSRLSDLALCAFRQQRIRLALQASSDLTVVQRASNQTSLEEFLVILSPRACSQFIPRNLNSLSI